MRFPVVLLRFRSVLFEYAPVGDEALLLEGEEGPARPSAALLTLRWRVTKPPSALRSTPVAVPPPLLPLTPDWSSNSCGRPVTEALRRRFASFLSRSKV